MDSWNKLVIFIFFISSCSISQLKLTEDIVNSPYAMQTISIDNKKEELLFLNDIDGSIQRWSRDKNLILITSNGKIIKSYGLNNDFELNSYKGISELKDSTSLIRFKNPESNYLEINFSYHILETGVMKKLIDQSEFKYTLIEEKFDVPLIRWKGSNLYWIDKDGYVWATEQIIDPFGKSIKSTTLKKYSD